MAEDRCAHFTLWPVGSQRLEVDFQAGPLVADAGLLVVRQLDLSLGVLNDLAQRLPDPRATKYVHHSQEALLVQLVYQFLAGYPDGNDAAACRADALFQVLAGLAPDPERPLACTSTLNRYLYGYTRRDARLPREDRPALLVQRRAQTQRLKALNEFLIDLFIRTRPIPPAQIVLDLDATDDAVHGRQPLSAYHGYYRQHQYLPLLAFEGTTGFPLCCWLRHGTAHAACGAAEVVRQLVERLRRAWPGIVIVLRGDCGLAVPGVLECCEEQGLGYALGYPQNPVLARTSEHWLAELELVHHFYGRVEPAMRRFEQISDYQAQSWPRPRRVVVKVEVTPQGSQRRFVVTNLAGSARQVYQDFYVQRGAVPEQPIGELKNGLSADRLSASGFCANALKLLVAVVAYALVVLFREASAALAEVATADVGTLRQRLWKVPAEVSVASDVVRVSLPAGWPQRELFGQALQAVHGYAGRITQGGETVGAGQPA